MTVKPRKPWRVVLCCTRTSPQPSASAKAARPAPSTPAEYEAEMGIKAPVVIPPPKYLSYEAYRAVVPLREVRAWCARKGQRANRVRLMSGRPMEKVTTDDVYAILDAARGRCFHCGSLAVEGAPVDPVTRKPLPWSHVGRRIGSLDHIVSRFDGGPNTVANLRWSCHWCNTWVSERIVGATDHGAIQADVA